MAVTSTQISVTNAATLLVAAPVPVTPGFTYSETAEANIRYVVITNGATAIAIGGSAAVTATGATGGLLLGANATIANVIPLRPSEALYAITASSTSTVSVLVTGA